MSDLLAQFGSVPLALAAPILLPLAPPLSRKRMLVVAGALIAAGLAIVGALAAYALWEPKKAFAAAGIRPGDVVVAVDGPSGSGKSSVSRASGCAATSVAKPSTSAGSRFSGESRASDRIRSPHFLGG